MRRLLRSLALMALLLAATAAADPAVRSGTAMRPGTERPRPRPDEITVFVARHAEKDTTLPGTPLSAAGERRARELARMLGESGVSRVYSSPRKRSIDTGMPLAAAIGDSVRVVPDVAGVVRRIRRDHRGARVLVIGHSSTVPEIVEALSGFRPPDLADEEYDVLFVVTLSGSAPATVYSLRYGEAGPAR